MTQALAQDVMAAAPRRASDRVAAPADYAAAFAARPSGLATEDELDWLENHSRPAYVPGRTDAVFIAFAVVLTAAVVGLTIGILKLF